MDQIEEKTVAKVRFHVASAMTALKDRKKAANLNKALTNLECAKSILDLILPTKERRRHRVKGEE